MVVCTLLPAIVLIAPSIDPYRSTKTLALELDRLLDPGEKIVFYRRLYPSTLFYTDRQGTTLITPDDLENYFATDKQVYCIINRRRMKSLTPMPYAVVKIGNKLIISNKKPF